jgi:hypothetical protein
MSLTSRQKLLLPSQPLDLDVLDEENALKLLAAILDDGRIEAELEAAKNLCKWLGYLPLALELVGSYLSLSPLMNITEVQEQLELLFLDSPLLTSEEKGVAAAFELTWQDPKLSPQAKELACRLSLFGSKTIAPPSPVGYSRKRLPSAKSALQNYPSNPSAPMPSSYYNPLPKSYTWNFKPPPSLRWLFGC